MNKQGPSPARRICRRVCAVAAVIGALIGLTAWPAAASGTGEIMLSGSGTLFPGLSLTPTFQTSVAVASDVTVYAGTINDASYTGIGASCRINGASNLPETIQFGQGTATLVCNGGSPSSLALSGNVNYQRTLTTMNISGSVSGSIAGVSASCTMAGELELAFTSASTIRSFRTAGHLLLGC